MISQQLTLELCSESVYETDLALTGAIGRDVLATLEQEGYSIQSVRSQTPVRGGELLVELVKTAWDHKETIERALTDLSSLITILTGTVVPVVVALVQAHKKRVPQDSLPIKTVVEIEGAIITSITVEARDLQDEQAVMKDALKLAQQFNQQHPDVARKVTPQSKTSVKAVVPAQPRRKRK